MGKGAGPDGVEGFIPGNEIPCKSSPEFGWIFDGLFVCFLILFQAMNVRSGMFIQKFWMVIFFRFRSFDNNL